MCEQDAKFTVDTHLFRELGELLVGRDSTALVELIKNAYDADATEVTVYGESLSSPENGKIVITDNGVGMTRDLFVRGFLRIASRLRDQDDRRSALFKRRFTGAKGVGRLAAQKLAKLMSIESNPNLDIYGEGSKSIQATIDWDLIESKETMDDLPMSGAIQLIETKRRGQSESGTIIELKRLRKKWTSEERERFFREIMTFNPPTKLVDFPINYVKHPLLFKTPIITETKQPDPGIKIKMLGDLESGDDYWDAVVKSANWVIEIDSTRKDKIDYAITPTTATLKEFPNAHQMLYSISHPDPTNGPFFQARIVAREGAGQFSRNKRIWLGKESGIRIYMEGFRVLPYGEAGDDWLEIDADYVKRTRSLLYLKDDFDEEPNQDKDDALSFRRNKAYMGAIFLTQEKSSSLRMVVNREGFVPDAAFESLKIITRKAVDLSVRHAALIKQPKREERREIRRSSTKVTKTVSNRYDLREEEETKLRNAKKYAEEAEKKVAEGNIPEAGKLYRKATKEFIKGTEAHERLMTERSMMQILAAVGLQMASYVHEISSLIGVVHAIEDAIKGLLSKRGLVAEIKRDLSALSLSTGDLRRVVERQASYLVDITSPDARRRRSRQNLAERFDSGAKIVKPSAIRRGITIENAIPPHLTSPPMFPAELTLVFSNLLSNAIKACDEDGRIRASGARGSDKTTTIRIENTGLRVKLSEAERWFRPFESTTTEIDPILGQGMGMGLPITRNILEEYGAQIQFVEPRSGFDTAVEIHFP